MEIVNSLPKNLKNDAFEIYHDAFHKKENLKITFNSKKQAIKLYKRGINFRSGLYAIKNGRLMGLLGFKSKRNKLIDYKLKTLRKEFGFFGGLIRKIRCFFSQIEHLSEDEIKIEAIAVDKKYRGKGIGSRLIRRAIHFAKNRKYKRIILNVVNTNPKAKKLYLRFGFKPISKSYFGFITNKAGFTSSTKMALDLN